MYHEIEGQLSIEPIIFDEEELVARGHHYPYDEIVSLEITSAQVFSPYGIMTIHTKDKDIPVPFARSRKAKLELAMREFEKTRVSGGSDTGEAVSDRSKGGQPAAMDPYEELKKLKELLDLDIVTQEEFDAKKKKLLDL
jgi:hypothetical protein